MNKPRIIFILFAGLLTAGTVFAQKVEFWLTRSDRTALLAKQTAKPEFSSKKNGLTTIEVDDGKTFQEIDGFGYSLTGGSAYVINRLGKEQKEKLLQELFGTGENSIGVSYLRISIGASDLNFAPFSYDDPAAGETDPGLEKFSLAEDEKDVIPILKEIVRLNPKIKLLGSPWSAPPWMKDNRSFKGGSLRPEYYGIYARYFVKYIHEMTRRGITIDAVTPQNEPLHPGNNPSMLMTAREQAEFIKNHLGPEFKKAGIKTKIIIYDHNCDKPEYPLEVLSDAGAAAFIDGSAFHLYAGEINALTAVHDAHPDKNVYFTEQYTSTKGTFAGDLGWHIKNLIIGAVRNWSRTVLEWNLASDGEFKPFTAGGCSVCKGALTIDGNAITRNASYYIIAHAAKFVPPGSIRIESNIAGNIDNVAFRTPNGKIVLIAQNDGLKAVNFNIKFKNRSAPVTLPAGGVGTFVW
jgi:glucosylceramidase